MKNKVITSQGNVQFIFPDGKVVNVHPNHIYTAFNEDTVSFILVALPKSSGLALMTSKAEDLELNGETYSFAELPAAMSEAFAIAGAQARCEIVDELPETGYTNTIYLVPQPSPQTGFDEYVYVDGEWELIGDTSIEMENYVTKTVFNGYTASTAVELSGKAEVVEITQANYDLLPSSAKTDATKLYVISDAQPIDLSVYAKVSALTEEISARTDADTALDNKIGVVSGAVDTKLAINDFNTYSAATDAALANKQNTLIAGENITISSTTSGDVISAEGGGKAIEAGRGIAITTGETADTVSFDLPIYAGTGQNSIIIGDGRNISSGNLSVAEGSRTSATTTYAHSEGSRTLASGSYSSHAEGSQTSATSEGSHSEGYQTTASGKYSHSEGWGTLASGQTSHSEGVRTSATTSGAHSEGSDTLASGPSSHSEGYQTTAGGRGSHSEGYGTTASGEGSHTEGQGTIALNKYEHSEGYFNVSSSGSSTFGDSGNTLFSVGNGTADNARHNAFEIRQNGDIYITKDGSDVKLQDQLGGGGSITVDSALDSGSTNPVENQALWDELRLGGAGLVETTLTFGEYGYSTNYPSGSTEIKVEVVDSMNNSVITFFNDGIDIGGITVNNYGSISVDTSVLQSATYEISGTTVIISYPTVTNVTEIQVTGNNNYVYKAVTTGAPTALKDQVVANATALGGLKLQQISQSDYESLQTKDSSTLYIII